MIKKLQINPQLEGQDLINYQSKKFLQDTDWKVIRHRDQLDAGLPASLTDAEYQELLRERQQARDNIIE